MIGEDDKRVPPKQGHELRRALRARGVPVRYVIIVKTILDSLRRNKKQNVFFLKHVRECQTSASSQAL